MPETQSGRRDGLHPTEMACYGTVEETVQERDATGRLTGWRVIRVCRYGPSPAAALAAAVEAWTYTAAERAPRASGQSDAEITWLGSDA